MSEAFNKYVFQLLGLKWKEIKGAGSSSIYYEDLPLSSAEITLFVNLIKVVYDESTDHVCLSLHRPQQLFRAF